FSFYAYGDHRDLHSFPTRRSSDLLKGKVTGITRLSRKAKLLMSLVGVAAVIGIVASIMTVGDDQSASANGASPGAADSTKAKEVDRKSTRLNSSHVEISYAVFCLK